MDITKLPFPIWKYLDYLEIDRNFSPGTIKNYTSDLTIFFKWLLLHRCIVTIKWENQNEFKTAFYQIDLSPLTIDYIASVTENEIKEYFRFSNEMFKIEIQAKTRKIACLKSFYKYLTLRDKSIQNNPLSGIEYPKIPDKKHIYMSIEEVEKLLNTMNNNEDPFKIRNMCMVILFLNTGMRLSELASLNLDSIRGNFDYLAVMGKGNKERYIPLNKTCASWLQSYLLIRPKGNKIKPNSQNAIFLSKNYSRITTKGIQDAIKKALKKADLPDYYSTHKLRHTFATNLYESGAVDVLELQELLGHSSPETTKIYTSISQDRLKFAVEKSPFNK